MADRTERMEKVTGWPLKSTDMNFVDRLIMSLITYQEHSHAHKSWNRHVNIFYMYVCICVCIYTDTYWISYRDINIWSLLLFTKQQELLNKGNFEKKSQNRNREKKSRLFRLEQGRSDRDPFLSDSWDTCWERSQACFGITAPSKHGLCCKD